jgi:hypothetical protein
MIQDDIESQNLKTDVVHVVLRLASAIIVRYHRLGADDSFDNEFVNLLLDFVHIMTSFTQMLKINPIIYVIDAFKAPFVADVHVFRIFIELKVWVVLIDGVICEMHV